MESAGGGIVSGSDDLSDRRPVEEKGNDTLRDTHLLKNSRKSFIKISLMFAASAVACYVLYSFGNSNQYYSIALPMYHSPNEISQRNGSDHTKRDTRPSPVNQENEESQLVQVLDKAAMPNKTVIIATLNAAWTSPNSIFDLFLESFRIGNGTQRLLCHVVVVALDQKAYSRCLEVHPHCYPFSTKGVDFSGEARFMAPDYLKMMWRRMEFLNVVLQMGYSFIVTDVDIMWFRDPFTRFHRDGDMQVSSDAYRGSSTDPNNIANTGFYYIKSNEQTIKFYKFWCKSKDRLPNRHDQDVFNMIRRDPDINQIGVKIEFLDTAFFGGFCEPSKDLNLVCTMHANCCVGSDNKVHDLRILIDDWKNYMALPIEERIAKPQKWTVPRICDN